MKARALAVFHRPPERLNCAQAVLAAHQAVTGDHSLAVASFKPWGGGRAPDGRCGALHAACLLAPASEEKLCAAFLIRIGALRCREIERPCVQCVGTAAELLEQAADGSETVAPAHKQPALRRARRVSKKSSAG